jgi:hypothetical protein
MGLTVRRRVTKASRPTHVRTVRADDLPPMKGIPMTMAQLPPPDPASQIPPGGRYVTPPAGSIPLRSMTAVEAKSDAWFWIAVCAAGVAVVAAFLPWISATTVFGSISRSGVDYGDGFFTAGLGVGVGAIALTLRRGRRREVSTGIALVVCSALMVVVSVWDWFQVNGRVRSIESQVAVGSVGFGLYLTMAAGIAGVVAGVMRGSQD